MKNMKKRTNPMLGLLLGVALVGSACSSTTEEGAKAPIASVQPAAERVMKDALGHEVKIPANPQRIIGSYLEDHLVALGVKPVAQWSVNNGKTVQNYLQKDLNGIPTIPSDLPFESVLSFTPDLILVDSADQVAGDKYDRYAKIAPTFTVGNATNNDWRQEFTSVADVLNKSEQAKKVLTAYDAKVKDAKEKLQQAIGNKTVAVFWVTEKAVYVPNEKLSSGDVLYHDLGMNAPDEIREISKTATANWSAISMEKLAQMKIDYIFMVNNKGVSKAEMMKDPVWAGIPAVKNGQVFEYDSNASWLYTGAIANSQMIDNVLHDILKK